MSDERIDGPGGGEQPATAMDPETGKFDQPIGVEDTRNIPTEQALEELKRQEEERQRASKPFPPPDPESSDDEAAAAAFVDARLRAKVDEARANGDEEFARVLDAMRESYAAGRPHRVLEPGTKILLAGPHGAQEEIELFSPAVVGGGRFALADQAFVGLLLGHQGNFRLNVAQLPDKYSPLTGVKLDVECDTCGAVEVEGVCSNPACPAKRAGATSEAAAAPSDGQEH